MQNTPCEEADCSDSATCFLEGYQTNEDGSPLGMWAVNVCPVHCGKWASDTTVSFIKSVHRTPVTVDSAGVILHFGIAP